MRRGHGIIKGFDYEVNISGGKAPAKRKRIAFLKGRFRKG